MDTFIDHRFERLEKALANLIDSVTKYHPSTLHAQELEAADNELSKGLEEGKCLLTLFLALMLTLCSSNTPEQLPTDSATPRIFSSSRRPDPRHHLESRNDAQGHRDDACYYLLS